SSSVPQLVVSLRFDAVGQPAATRREARPAEEPTVSPARSSRPPPRKDVDATVESDGADAGETREAAPATKRATPAKSEPSPARARASTPPKAPADDDAAEASDATDEDEVEAMRRGRLHDVGDRLKTGASAAMEKIGPAMSGLGERARTLWGRAQKNIQRPRENKEAAKPRRVTAPPPGGALKAAGRRVVRSDDDAEATATP